MNATFDNNLAGSFCLYVDNLVLTKGAAYTNVTGNLYQTTTKLISPSVYSSPYGQIVSDTSVAGAIVPSGFTLDGNFTNRGPNLMIDFNHGRIVCPSGTQYNQVVGSYAMKDFDIFYSSETEENLLFDTSFRVRTKMGQNVAPLKEGEKSFPAIYIKYTPGENRPFAFGGQDETNSQFRCIILSDSMFKLEAAMCILRDSARSWFAMLNPADIPFNEWGDLKTGDFFNYKTLSASKSPNDLIYIDRVRITKFREIANTNIGRNVFGGFADFDLKIPRYPRA